MAKISLNHNSLFQKNCENDPPSNIINHAAAASGIALIW